MIVDRIRHTWIVDSGGIKVRRGGFMNFSDREGLVQGEAIWGQARLMPGIAVGDFVLIAGERYSALIVNHCESDEQWSSAAIVVRKIRQNIQVVDKHLLERDEADQPWPCTLMHLRLISSDGHLPPDESL